MSSSSSPAQVIHSAIVQRKIRRIARRLQGLCACDRLRVVWQNSPASPLLTADLLRVRGKLPVRDGATIRVECGGVGPPPSADAITGAVGPAFVVVRSETGGRFSVTCSRVAVLRWRDVGRGDGAGVAMAVTVGRRPFGPRRMSDRPRRPMRGNAEELAADEHRWTRRPQAVRTPTHVGSAV